MDDDSRCLGEVDEVEEEEWVPDYSKEYEDYWQEYQQYSADQLQLYQDFINDEVKKNYHRNSTKFVDLQGDFSLALPLKIPSTIHLT